MKTKLFLILCLFALSMNVWADPHIVTGNGFYIVWSLFREYYSFADKAWEHRTDHYFLEKDTTIGSKVYREVFWREEGDRTKQTPAGYALREDSDRVYVYDYASQREYVFYDFSLKKNDILTVDWIEETESRKNPVFRVLDVGDTTICPRRFKYRFHYLIVYDIVHQVTDMWLPEVGSVSHGIAWHRDFGASLDTLETVLCVNGDDIYVNPEYKTCYIPKSEPEYVSCKEKLIAVREPELSSPWYNSPRKMLGIKWRGRTPIFVVDSKMWNVTYPFRIQGVEYKVGDSVEVEGYVSIQRDIHGLLYSIIELEGFASPVVPVSIERSRKAELKLSPNSAQETITLSATGCQLQRVEILDVNGRVLYAATLNGAESFDYNVSQMPSGLYLARVKTSCGVLTEKFSVR